MSKIEQIKSLDGSVSLDQFLEREDLKKLSKDEMQALLKRTASLNSRSNLDAQFKIVLDECVAREEKMRFWLPVWISVGSLIVSIVALLK